MKISIRPCTFETNSSMTHAMAIVEGEILEKWKAGELLVRVHGISCDVESDDDWEDVPVITWNDVEELDEDEIAQEFGVHPEKPYYSHEERFPYAMFADDSIKEEWIETGGVFRADISEGYHEAEIDIIYMG